MRIPKHPFFLYNEKAGVLIINFRNEMEENKNQKVNEILKELKSFSNSQALAGMARFGINVENAFGTPVPVLRKIAKRIGKNHSLASALWKTKNHEARILAGFIDQPESVTEEQMESWARDLDSWDVCDQICGGLFDKTPFAYLKAVEWSGRKEEFVKRAGFALMAALAVHDKSASDKKFLKFFPLIKIQASDERNFVKKSVNWALRQIGKRNAVLNSFAIAAAQEILKQNGKTAKWIASNALGELRGEAVKNRLNILNNEQTS